MSERHHASSHYGDSSIPVLDFPTEQFRRHIMLKSTALDGKEDLTQKVEIRNEDMRLVAQILVEPDASDRGGYGVVLSTLDSSTQLCSGHTHRACSLALEAIIAEHNRNCRGGMQTSSKPQTLAIRSAAAAAPDAGSWWRRFENLVRMGAIVSVCLSFFLLPILAVVLAFPHHQAPLGAQRTDQTSAPGVRPDTRQADVMRQMAQMMPPEPTRIAPATHVQLSESEQGELARPDVLRTLQQVRDLQGERKTIPQSLFSSLPKDIQTRLRPYVNLDDGGPAHTEFPPAPTVGSPDPQPGHEKLASNGPTSQFDRFGIPMTPPASMPHNITIQAPGGGNLRSVNELSSFGLGSR